MKKYFIVIGLCLALLALASCSPSKNDKKKTTTAASASAPAAATEESKLSEIDLSFIQTARSALLKNIPNRPGYYTLTLYDITPYLTYYAKRPSRMTGLVPIENFIKAWDVGVNSFKDNPPNGVITAGFIDGVPNKGNTIYLILFSIPKYDSKKNVAQYTVQPIGMKKFLLEHIKLENVTVKIN